MIKAYVYTGVADDGEAMETEFDAEPWFEQATEKQIADVVAADFGDSYATDNIFDWAMNKFPDLGLREIHEFTQANDVTWTVSLDADAAKQWLAERASKLVARNAVDTLLGPSSKKIRKAHRPRQESEDPEMGQFVQSFMQSQEPIYLRGAMMPSLAGVPQANAAIYPSGKFVILNDYAPKPFRWDLLTFTDGPDRGKSFSPRAFHRIRKRTIGRTLRISITGPDYRGQEHTFPYDGTAFATEDEAAWH